LSSCDQIKAVAAFAGLEIAAPASYEHYVDNKKPEFLSKFPHGKIPAFEGADGFKVVEGAVVARYSESSYRSSYRSQSLGETEL
jgi:elongation factor 1-gamma